MENLNSTISELKEKIREKNRELDYYANRPGNMISFFSTFFALLDFFSLVLGLFIFGLTGEYLIPIILILGIIVGIPLACYILSTLHNIMLSIPVIFELNKLEKQIEQQVKEERIALEKEREVGTKLNTSKDDTSKGATEFTPINPMVHYEYTVDLFANNRFRGLIRKLVSKQ